MLLNFGWRSTFALVGFAALLWLVPWLLTTPAQLRAPKETRPSPSDGGIGSGVLALLTNRNLLGVCLAFFCFDYYWYFLVTWLPDYLVTARGLTILRAGIYAALPYFVFGASEPIGGWIADRLVRMGWSETRARKSVVTVAFLTGLLLIPAARVTSAGAAVGLIIGGCLVGLATGNLLVILQSCAPPAKIGLWTGVYNFIGNIAGILSPLITGFLIDRSGSYAPPFMLAAGLIALGPLALWFVIRELRAAEEPAAATGRP